MQFLSDFGIKKPRFMMWLSFILCITFITLVALPTVWPERFETLHVLKIDTDPENMLSEDEPSRVFHNKMKGTYNLYDMVVIGVVNHQHENGVFTPESLTDIYTLSKYAETLQWQGKDGQTEGVVSVELVAPNTVDNIEQAGEGTVSFSWLMAHPPKTAAEALAVRDKAKHLPMLNNTLVSDDGTALAIYLPITSKDMSYKVAQAIEEKVATFTTKGNDYHITGLPVAQDQFGVEMFFQMAVSAPAAMALIFVLMLLFFKNIRLVVSPMIVAMVSVITTMGILIATGHTVHIMSSMIPIFIMPIAVLDSVHILSDFFDKYQEIGDRKKTLKHVMSELSAPMFYTTLTTTAGFASLALTPIPPVQVFGIFVAIGVVFAWLFTITLVPAYIMLMPESSLKNFGHTANENTNTILDRVLKYVGRLTYNKSKSVLLFALALMGVAVYGITQIQINDNPVKWFAESHPIRVADRELNDKFAGTYMAYLNLKAIQEDVSVAQAGQALATRFEGSQNAALHALAQQMPQIAKQVATQNALMLKLSDIVEEKLDTVADDAWDAWDDASLLLAELSQSGEVFKQPEMLHYIEKLQVYLLETGLVGKSSALPDVVKTVHRELFLGKDEAFRIPDTKAAVAQTLITFQNSHRPNDLWHFATTDYTQANLWLQLKSGDNKDMSALVEQVEVFFKNNPAPLTVEHQWFGLTYINVVWQDKMVSGMAEAFIGSFIIVLLMMIFLFRSLWFGILAMIPLAFTIIAIYGIIGLIGKDYDMPVAVLSSLSLGLAVDYAIHFLARSRTMYKEHKNWHKTTDAAFGEPARAITRNVIVLGFGFVPLLAAPLVPYNTVGVFISAILLMAGVATLLILPSLMKIFEKTLFKKELKEIRKKIK